MNLLSVSSIDTGYGDRQVLSGVTFDVSYGEIILFVGSNGSGKSTLLKALYGILPIWQGSVNYGGELLHSEKKHTEPEKLINRGMMYIPQRNELFEDLSVLDNLKASLLHLDDRNMMMQRIEEVFELIPSLKDKRTGLAGRLSGGERKMLSLGMVMANKPVLLLYDEPLAGLDAAGIPVVIGFLDLIRKSGFSVLIVEHRVGEISYIADRIFGLRLGKLYDGRNFDTLDKIKSFMVL